MKPAPASARITLVISNMTFGGAQRVLSILANSWAAQGAHVRLLSLRDDEKPFFDLDPRVEYKALNYRWGRRRGWPSAAVFLRNLARLRGDILSGRPDAVISFLDETNVRVLLALAGTRVPVIVSERNDPSGRKLRRFWGGLRNVAYLRARAVVVQTERTGSHFAFLGRRLVVIPNPVPPPATLSGEATEFPGIDENVVLSVGKLHPQKGFDLLLHAFARLAPGYPLWRLVVLGEGPERAGLERLLRALGLEGRAFFPGRARHPLSAMKTAGLYVSSSRYEGFPNALCEALAAGMPVISTDCPSGPREIITDGIDGVLVPNEDIDALEAAMRRLLEDPALRLRLAAEAGRITQRYSVESVMRRWDETLEAFCAVDRPGRASLK